MRFFGRKKSSADPLDTVLLNWTPTDPYSARAMLGGGVLVTGGTGSGKSSTTANLLAESVMKCPYASMQVHLAKPEDLDVWKGIHTRSGRPQKLITFAPGEGLHFNVTNYLVSKGADAREITQFFMTIGELLNGSDGNSGGDDGAFWEKQQKRAIYDAVVIVKLATGKVSASDLQAFIGGAAQTPSELTNPQWQEGFHYQTFLKAFSAQKSETDAFDFESAKRMWLGEWPPMADRTRSSIVAGVMGLLHEFCTGQVQLLFNTTTNVTPEVMLREGHSLLVNAPVTQLGATGKLINGVWKYITQWTVLRRHAKLGDFINVIFADEAHNIFNSFDAKYISEARSHLGCLIYLTQGIDSFFSVLGGKGAEAKVNVFLAQFGHHVVHALSDPRTAEHYSKLVGRKTLIRISGSAPPPDDIFGELMGGSKVSASFNEHMENILEPRVFMSGLRKGGPPHFTCDAILIRSGEPFSNGHNWLRLALKQRRA